MLMKSCLTIAQTIEDKGEEKNCLHAKGKVPSKEGELNNTGNKLQICTNSYISKTALILSTATDDQFRWDHKEFI